MARILALDYGTKRTGIAVTDPDQLIATGLTTVSTKDAILFIKGYMQKERVECIVIGEPKRMDNTASSVSGLVMAFVKKLATEFPEVKMERYDERFTSRMAFQAMIDGGLKKKDRQDKKLVDMISATLILQSFLADRERKR